ncbi:MAG TPA: hypothetical protein VL002_09535, partial [Candidimonas sp.]|nr:hypothetical protein [Candidimonas sp.]
MIMNQKNKYLAIGSAIAAITVVGWFALSHVATSRAEESISAFLDEYGIRQNVQWESLSASPFGNVKIENVSIRVGSEPEALRITHIQLKDFTDTKDRKRIDLQLNGMSDAQGRSPLGDLDYIQAGGRANLPPLSVHVKWDMLFDDDEGKVELSFNQPDAMQGGLAFELDKISALNNLQQNILAGSIGGMGKRNMFGGHPLLSAAEGALAALGEVRIKSLNANIKDEGHMARSIALYKRYSTNLSTTDSNPGKVRDKKFKEEIKSGLKACQAEASDTFKGVPKIKDSCAAVLDFASGESRHLKLEAKPTQPVSMLALFQASMSRP